MGQREKKSLSIASVDAAAAEWLAKLQHEDLPPAERIAFDQWMDADPAHAVAFARIEYAWEHASRLQAAPRIPERVASPPRRPVWGIAAGFLAAMIGAMAWYFTWQSTAYTTALGERRSVALADGSQVNLNTASRIEVELGEQQRIVRLVSGEGLFKVAHDEQRPFIVIAGNTSVRAVGTAFNVRLRGPQQVEVTVTDGVVAIGEQRVSADSVAMVVAGEMNRVELTPDDVQRRVAWREGVIALNGETLAQAVEEFNRYREHKLVVADPTIAQIRVGGRFETDEADKFLNAVTAGFPVRVVKGEDDRVFLLRRP